MKQANGNFDKSLWIALDFFACAEMIAEREGRKDYFAAKIDTSLETTWISHKKGIFKKSIKPENPLFM
jgi:hypothetical protein